MKEREKEALFALLWNLFSALSPSHPAKVFQSESVRSYSWRSKDVERVILSDYLASVLFEFLISPMLMVC
jgi:hypothetical protein